MRSMPKILRTRVTEEELNVVANLALREDCTAGQLIRRFIREHAARVPTKARRKLSDPPKSGMRATILKVKSRKRRKR